MRIKHACLICSIPFGTKFGLCAYCAEQLYALREPATRTERDLNVHSLFAWRKDGWPALRTLAKKLKGKDDPEPWLELALWMVQAKGENPARKRRLVPVPSVGPNHALGWARALSQWTGWPVEDSLRTTSVTENKHLSRAGRRQRRFSGGPCTKYTEVVIVDDIVTTGATAVAAYQALGRPRNCEVWCLMDRRPWH